MAISYTDNFNFPLLEAGSDGWDAVINGMITDLDTEVKAAQTPIVLTSAQIVVSKRLGEVVLKHYQ
jgi:uncharacterized alpha/beta hydrolase family protein